MLIDSVSDPEGVGASGFLWVEKDMHMLFPFLFGGIRDFGVRGTRVLDTLALLVGPTNSLQLRLTWKSRPKPPSQPPQP